MRRRTLKDGSLGSRVYVKASPLERFTGMVRKRDDTCWEWTGSRMPAGYGRFSFDGETMGLAHRFSYMSFRGPLLEGMEIDHLCRNRWCVNPSHLEQVTSRENNLRSIPYRKTHTETACKNGHEWTERNRYVMPNGKVNCRDCRNESAAVYRERQRANRRRAA